MQEGVKIEFDVHFEHGKRGRRKLNPGPPPTKLTPPVGKIPRISRLMALAIRFDELIRAGEVADYAELARLGHITRARMTQIMNLLNLAPDIQEKLLFLPLVTEGRDPVGEKELRSIAVEARWNCQRCEFASIAN